MPADLLSLYFFPGASVIERTITNLTIFEEASYFPISFLFFHSIHHLYYSIHAVLVYTFLPGTNTSVKGASINGASFNI